MIDDDLNDDDLDDDDLDDLDDLDDDLDDDDMLARADGALTAQSLLDGS